MILRDIKDIETKEIFRKKIERKRRQTHLLRQSSIPSSHELNDFSPRDGGRYQKQQSEATLLSKKLRQR